LATLLVQVGQQDQVLNVLQLAQPAAGAVAQAAVAIGVGLHVMVDQQWCARG
jgi:hypothetical protein